MTDGWKEREATNAVGIGDSDDQVKKVLGLLADIRTDVGENKSNVYELVQETGESLNVWGSAVIDSKLRASDVGKFVKLTYLGIGQSRAGRNFKDINVLVWDGELNDRQKEWPRLDELQNKKPGQAEKQEPDNDFSDFPEALDDGDDDLPF